MEHKRPTERYARSPTPVPQPLPAADRGTAANGAAPAQGGAVEGTAQPAVAAAAQPQRATGRIEAGAFSDAGPHVSRSRRCFHC